MYHVFCAWIDYLKSVNDLEIVLKFVGALLSSDTAVKCHQNDHATRIQRSLCDWDDTLKWMPTERYICHRSNDREWTILSPIASCWNFDCLNRRKPNYASWCKLNETHMQKKKEDVKFKVTLDCVMCAIQY